MSKWQEVALADICDISIGRTPTRKESKYWGGEHPWLSISDMNQGRTLISTKERITDTAVIERKCKLVNSGTVLLSFKLSIGKVGITQIPMYTNEAIAALPIRDESVIEADYLARALESLDLTKGQDRAAMGSTLNLPKLRKIKIPLPPLDEQRRIAAILDKADELRSKRREAIAKLDTLAKSIFIDMFGDPVTNPKEFRTSEIGEFASVKGGKRLPKGDSYSDTPTPYRYIRVADLKPNMINTSDLKFLRADTQKKISRYTVASGDVIISIAGTIGVTAAVTEELDGANLTENAAKIVPVEKSEIDAVYLSHALQMPQAQFQIAGQTGRVTIGKLALFRVEKINVVVPPLHQQRIFNAAIKAVDLRKTQQMNYLYKLDRLFASLQQRAFRGEL